MDELTHLKLCILGTGGVGKTALLRRYLTGEFREEYNPTVENTHREIKRIPRYDSSFDNVVLLDVVDTSGQDTFYQDMLEEWIIEADGFVLVFSVDSNGSLTDLNMFYNKIQEIKGPDVPIVIIGNKCDLSVVVNDSLLKMCHQNWTKPIRYVSAKTGENVTDSIHMVLREIIATKDKTTNFLELWLQIRESFEDYPYHLVDEILQFLYDEPFFRQMKAFSHADKEKGVQFNVVKRPSSRVLQTDTSCSIM